MSIIVYGGDAYMTKTEAAYFAGIIDGEGSLRIFEMKQKRPATGQPYTVAHLRLSVGNTDGPLVHWLRQMTGSGAIQFIPIRKDHPNWKSLYQIVWSTGSAGPLLKQMLPYLRLKKRHAEIALDWIELSREMRHHVGGRGRTDRTMPPEIREKRDALLTELKSLNRRGVPLSS